MKEPLGEERAVWPTLTGHEGTTYLAGTALTLIGRPLSDFIDASMRSVHTAAPAAFASWMSVREVWNDKRSRDPEEFPREQSDARHLIYKELKPNFEVLVPFFEQGGRADGIPQLVRDAFKPTRFAAHRAMHGGTLTIVQAERFVRFVQRIALLIGALPEADYLEPLAKTLESRKKASQSRQPPPALKRLDDTISCLGAHWAQPQTDVPGSWWLIGVRAGKLSTLEAELSSGELVDALQAEAKPSVIGLAFCFSAPRHYMLDRGFREPMDLWGGISPFTNRTMARAIEQLGAPFKVVEITGGDPAMRSRKDHPELFRATELGVARRTKTEPSSIFDVSGIDSVGALALNGMPVLTRLRETGVAVWPFDGVDDKGRTGVEIFPRSLWKALHPREDARSKKNAQRRRAFILDRRADGLAIRPGEVETITAHERAFDAFVTATSLARFGAGLSSIPISKASRLEGKIWIPE